MDYREHNGKRISRLGFGCMRFPKVPGDDYRIDETLAQKLLETAYESGVTYYDTAWPYHNKTSEAFLGKVLSQYPRESYALATKMPIGLVKTLDEAKNVFEQQKANLRTDYVDYYLLHGINYEKWQMAKETGIYDYLLQKKACGEIRNLGFSFHGYAKDVARILDDGTFDFVQIQLNYVDWEMQNAEYEYQTIVSRGLPVMVMEPCKGGALAALPSEAERILKEARPSDSIASWAMRWVASHDGVMVVLSGMSDEMQTADNLKTFDSVEKLSSEEEALVLKAKGIFLSSRTIACTKCQYCMPCTKGLVIPGIIALYNQYLVDHDAAALKSGYDALAKKGSDCIVCKACMPKCPQSINIVEHMKQIDRTARSL